MTTKNSGAREGSSMTRYTGQKTACDKKSNAVVTPVRSSVHVRVTADKMTARFRAAVKSSVLSQQQKGLPIAKYDTENKQAYLEYPGGHKQYIE